MITLKSKTEEGKKYFFEGFGFGRQSLKNGIPNNNTQGNLLKSITIDLNSSDYVSNQNLRKILEDSCPPEFIERQGIKATIVGYVQAFGWLDTQKKMYIHTIQEE